MWKRLALVVSVGFLLWCASPVWADWLSTDPYQPPSAQKAYEWFNWSCWEAAAANMLAAAGYGNGSDGVNGPNMQARAEGIYSQMVGYFGVGDILHSGGGDPATAAQWWLGSQWNTTPDNPYRNINVYGVDSSTPMKMSNWLRDGDMVVICYRYAPWYMSWGGNHIVNYWGDDGADDNYLTANPGKMLLTDSDRTAATQGRRGYVIDYNWHPYNAKDGWTFDCLDQTPSWLGGPNYTTGTLLAVTVLSSLTSRAESGQTTLITSSLRVQSARDAMATELDYNARAGVPVSGPPSTSIDYPTTDQPVLADLGNPSYGVSAKYTLTPNAGPYTSIKITTDAYVRAVKGTAWRTFGYDHVKFQYGDSVQTFTPPFYWKLFTPPSPDPTVMNATGGDILGHH